MGKMKMTIISVMLAAIMSACNDKPFVIVQVADAQLGFSAAEKSQRENSEYVNDLTYEAECLRKAVNMINGMCPDVVVFTGDQVNYPDNDEQWDVFAEIISEIHPSVKVFHLPGNHDVHIADSRVDSSPFTSRYGQDRFIYSENGVNLLGINTNLIKSCDSLETGQMDWLKETLAGTGPDEVTLLFGHHPFFLTDIDEPDSYFPIMKSKRRLYLDMLSDYGVDAVYAGHRHDTFEGEFEGIPVKTTTSVAFQIGDSQPSVRVITVSDGMVSDTLLTIE